jgi:hypothetical protein
VRCPCDPSIAAIRQFRAEPHVVGDDVLVEHVVGIDQEVPGLTHLDGSVMSGSWRTQLGHPEFNDEAPARCKVAGSILEATDLLPG